MTIKQILAVIVLFVSISPVTNVLANAKSRQNDFRVYGYSSGGSNVRVSFYNIDDININCSLQSLLLYEEMCSSFNGKDDIVYFKKYHARIIGTELTFQLSQKMFENLKMAIGMERDFSSLMLNPPR